MAKKKRKPPRRPPNRAIRPRPQSYSPPELPDQRPIEGVMKGFLGEMSGEPVAGTPLAKAQALMYQAFGTPDPDERARLAKQAIDLSPDCADAYVLLAEQTKSRKEALDLFEKGVAAGERALGATAFQEDVGHFWGLLETRPYMRAREGLASKLWTMGRRDEAIKHLQDMLRLNPGDNQGVRYTLSGWLLAEGRDEDLARLFKEYDECSANWAYTKALVAFRRNGDTPETRRLLKAAKKANKHVPAYLLGRKPLPQEPPSYYSPGVRARLFSTWVSPSAVGRRHVERSHGSRKWNKGQGRSKPRNSRLRDRLLWSRSGCKDCRRSSMRGRQISARSPRGSRKKASDINPG